jgi:hypothetical protein
LAARAQELRKTKAKMKVGMEGRRKGYGFMASSVLSRLNKNKNKNKTRTKQEQNKNRKRMSVALVKHWLSSWINGENDWTPREA